MTATLKSKMWGTLIVAALVITVFHMLPRPEAHTPNGHKKPEKMKMALLSVTFSNSPRDPAVHIAYTIGPMPPVQKHVAYTWQEEFPAAPGTRVEVGGRQQQPGALFCSAKVDTTVIDWDHNLDGRDWVLCEGVVPQ